MGEFNTAVSALLEAFSSGITIIRSLRRRRKEKKSRVDSAVKADESQLSKSLEKSRVHVRSAYKNNLERLGKRFAAGDAKSLSSFTSILVRLNAGFVSIIDRFTRGESTRTDYRTLVNLSNASRIEAIKTFEQLSSRISQSSIALSTTKSKHTTRRSSRGQNIPSSSSNRTSQSNRAGHVRSRSAPELAMRQTALGPATSKGWVRPNVQKEERKRKMDPSTTRRKPESDGVQNPLAAEVMMPQVTPRTHSLLLSGPGNRVSTVSFSSDSTKLGEIPEQRRPTVDADGQEYLISTAFPLAPWRKPDKPRSRFLRLFGK